MKLPNGYGSVVKLSGKRRKPWMVRKTTGYRIDPVKEKKVNEYIIIEMCIRDRCQYDQCHRITEFHLSEAEPPEKRIPK